MILCAPITANTVSPLLHSLARMTRSDPGLAMIIKQRPKAGQIGSMDLVGSVEDSDVVIVDDMIDTAGTLCSAADQLKVHGGEPLYPWFMRCQPPLIVIPGAARRVFAFATHGLFSGPASERIRRSALEEVVSSSSQYPIHFGHRGLSV